MGKRAVVRIVYKSGAQIDVKCDAFKVRLGGAGVSRVEWENAWPSPLFVGVDDIASVWQVK